MLPRSAHAHTMRTPCAPPSAYSVRTLRSHSAQARSCAVIGRAPRAEGKAPESQEPVLLPAQMARRQSACKSGTNRGRAAVEPLEYVGATKTCTECGSAQHSVFKFLNNKKPDQPSYKCMRCKTLYTHYPPGKARMRAHGKYNKHTLANPPEHAAMFDLPCPNLAFRAQNPAKPRFLYSNNNKPDQPRYVCLACHAGWQLKLENPPPRPDEVAPTLESLNVSGTDDMQAVYPQQWSYNPEECTSLEPGDPNFMDVMQAQQPPSKYLSYQIVYAGSCSESYPHGDPNYMTAMQGHHQYFDPNYMAAMYLGPTNNVTSIGSCTENANGAPNFVDAMQDAMQGNQQ